MASRDRRRTQSSARYGEPSPLMKSFELILTLIMNRGKKDAGREKANRNVNADMNSSSHSNSRSAAISHGTASKPRNTSQRLDQLTTRDTSSIDTDVLQSVSHDNEHAYDIAKMIARLDVGGISPTYTDCPTGGASDWSMIIHNDVHSASEFLSEKPHCVVEKTRFESETETERKLLMEHDLLGLGAQFE